VPADAVQGLHWLDAHPNADPIFKAYESVFGLVSTANQDAKDLEAAICDGVDPSGAMVHAVVNHLIWIKANGWEKYVAERTKRQQEESKP